MVLWGGGGADLPGTQEGMEYPPEKEGRGSAGPPLDSITSSRLVYVSNFNSIL